MTYLVLLPAFLLALGAIAVALIAQFYPRLRSTWLIVVGISLATWALVFAQRWWIPAPLEWSTWQMFNRSPAYLILFRLDSVSWPYAQALTALLLAMILTGSARLQVSRSPWPWAGSLILTGLGLLSILADTPLSLILTWTGIDLMELIIVLALAQSQQINRQAVLAFSIRVVGSLIVLGTLLFAENLGRPLTFDTISQQAAIWLLVAAGMRLGVLPLNLPYTHELSARRGLGTVVRMVAPASSLILLARLPADLTAAPAAPYLMGFTVLALLYGAAMWFAAEDELQGRPYWHVSMAGLAIACAILGQPQASIPWGIGLLLTGGLIFLYSARSRSLLFLLVLTLLTISGLPFTPFVPGWLGLAPQAFHPLSLLFALAVSLLWGGLTRHFLRPGQPLNALDRWVSLAYPFGLLLLPVNLWLIAILGEQPIWTLGRFWFPLASLLIGALVLLVARRRQPQVAGLSASWAGLVARRVGDALSGFFRLDWVYQFFWLLYGGAQRGVAAVTILLEGQGGVLWTLVLLVLLISLFSTGVQP